MIKCFQSRVFRICSARFLFDEEKFNENSFKLLHCPNYFLHNAKRKAYKLHRKKYTKITNNPNYYNKSSHLVLPTISITALIENNFSYLNLKFINPTSKTRREIVSIKRDSNNNRREVVISKQMFKMPNAVHRRNIYKPQKRLQ